MRFNDFVIPENLRSARAVLAELGDNGFAVAGGTSVQFMGSGQKTAVDISRLGLSGIEKKAGGFVVGATTTLDALIECRDPSFVLGKVARRTHVQQIRNVSTLGGNISRVFPWNDFPVALLALGASMRVAAKAKRSYSADEFFAGQPMRLLEAGELLTAVAVPALKQGRGFGYHKHTRVHAGFSMMTAAALLEVRSGRIHSARVAVGAGVPFPVRLPSVEAALSGRPADPAVVREAGAAGTKAVRWKGKEGMSDEYAGQLARVILCDVLTEALGQAMGEKP